MNNIPAMTNPLGKYWQQPDPKNFIVSYKYVLMTQKEFDELLEYSSSVPSGVYIGKLWKSHWSGIWKLVWLSEGDKEKTYLNNNYREILIK